MRHLLRTLALVCLTCTAVLAQNITLVEDPWPPYTYGENGAAPTKGAAVEVMEALFRDDNLSLRLYPWKRALMMAQKGEVDGLMLTIETNERLEHFVFSAPLFEDAIVFIVPQKSPLVYKDLDSLRGKTIGVVHGSRYSDAFVEKFEQGVFEIEASDTLETNIKKLASGRLEIIVASQSTFCGALKELGIPFTFRFLSPALKQSQFKMALSKASPWALHVDTINAKIETLRQSGALERIQARYFTRCN